MTESPERPVACSACGHAFDRTQPRQACPQCGSDRRTYEIELSAEQKAGASVVAHKPEVRYVFDSDGGTANEAAFVQKHGVTGTEGVRVERRDRPRLPRPTVEVRTVRFISTITRVVGDRP